MPWPFDTRLDTTSAVRLSEMERRMRTCRWDSTVVGPVESWPQNLKHAVRTVLDLRMPAYLAWGDEHVQFFNDAFMPILGAKIDGARGGDSRITWSEAWPTLQPMWDQVRQGATFADNEFQIALNRNGFAESCYFSHSYSPIYSESGAIDGVFVTCVETTKAVMGERR